MLYNFYLDGQLVENPKGWDKMITVIRRDRELKGQFVTMDVTFTFTSTGFSYLYDKFKTSGYCAEVLLKVEQSVDEGDNYINFYDGIIKISDVKFKGRQDNLEDDIIVEQSATTKVLDNSFFAKIFNNKSLKTNLCAGKSKNGFEIIPCEVNYLRMFDPATGIPVGLDQKEAISWYDAFRYLIEFMTDAKVEFDSSLLSGTGLYSGPILTYGFPIWNQGGGITVSDAEFIAKLPKISFEDLFREVDYKINLGLNVINTGGKPKVKIERWDDLFKSDISAQISNIPSIETRISVDDIFSSLKLGSTETLESDGALSFPETINYIGFKEEEYIVTGDCNIDSVLDLTGDFIVSSNVIEEILINNPAGTAEQNKFYNDKFFLIDAIKTGVGFYVATKSNWLDPNSAQRFYNERFTNARVANNFLKAVPNDIADYLGGPLDTSFTATRTFESESAVNVDINGYSLEPVGFDNDTTPPGTDPNGVYDTGTFEFTVPPLGAGQYSFYVTQPFRHRFSGVYQVGPSLPNTIQIQTRLYLARYDSLGVFIANYPVQDQLLQQSFMPNYNNQYYYYSTNWLVQGAATINLNDGDRLRVRFENDAPLLNHPTQGNYHVRYTIAMLLNSLYQCTGNATGGGNYQTYNPDDYPIILDSFEQEMTKAVFDKIAEKPLSLIEFSQGAQSYKRGWINQLRYDHLKGVAQITMLSARSTN